MKKGLQDILDNRSYDYVEAMEYMTNFAKEHTLKEYLDFIKKLKANVTIPIIASINCVSAYDWSFFAKRIQEAGADALELNIYILPSDITKTSANYDEMYKKIIQDVKRFVTIPVALKLSYYSSSLVHRFVELSNSGIAGIVLFNKPYNPDIDINKIEISTGKILSSESDYLRSLRWTAILSGRVGCDLAASTGVHSYETVVKMLLAGSNAVQVASLLYEKGIDEITHLVSGLNKWMDEHNFKTIDEFRGKLSQKNIENPAVLERVQFMKSYAGIN
jgi:dihydroorotate dehydrogenase (fumarate)